MFISFIYSISIDCPNLRILASGLGLQSQQPSIWIELQGDCCVATGIFCVSQRVTQISWFTSGLNGTIPPQKLPPK